MATNNLKDRTQRLVAEFCKGDDHAFAIAEGLHT